MLTEQTLNHRAHQALAASATAPARPPHTSRQLQAEELAAEETNPQKQEEDVTCPAGMDSKESEHPRAMGRSSGVRLSVDDRLLARASSCTNMIPGETRGRRVGQAGQGEQPFNKWGWARATGMAGG